MSHQTADATGHGLDMLTTDHREVEQLYDQLESAGEAGRTEDQEELAEKIIAELSVHATVEEQILYPAAREALADGDELADDGLQEHQEMKELLAELDGAAPNDPEFTENFDKPMGELQHHVEDEETRCSPRCGRPWASSG